MKRYSGSCHCGAVRYDVDLDLSKGMNRCNCTLCWKARAWFAFVGGDELRLLEGAAALNEYRWTPTGRPRPFLTYHFCRHCGVRLFASGNADFMGGKFYALAVSTLDNAELDELADAPMTYIDNLHDRFDEAPDDIRLL